MATGWKSAITFLSHFTSHLDAVPLPGAQYLEGVCHLQQVQVYCDRGGGGAGLHQQQLRPGGASKHFDCCE